MFRFADLSPTSSETKHMNIGFYGLAFHSGPNLQWCWTQIGTKWPSYVYKVKTVVNKTGKIETATRLHQITASGVETYMIMIWYRDYTAIDDALPKFLRCTAQHVRKWEQLLYLGGTLEAQLSVHIGLFFLSFRCLTSCVWSSGVSDLSNGTSRRRNVHCGPIEGASVLLWVGVQGFQGVQGKGEPTWRSPQHLFRSFIPQRLRFEYRDVYWNSRLQEELKKMLLVGEMRLCTDLIFGQRILIASRDGYNSFR